MPESNGLHNLKTNATKLEKKSETSHEYGRRHPYHGTAVHTRYSIECTKQKKSLKKVYWKTSEVRKTAAVTKAITARPTATARMRDKLNTG